MKIKGLLSVVFTNMYWIYNEVNIYLSNFLQIINKYPEAEFKEFKPRRWTSKSRFQLSASSNLKTLYKISWWTNRVWAMSKIRPQKNDFSHFQEALQTCLKRKTKKYRFFIQRRKTNINLFRLKRKKGEKIVLRF